MTIPTDVDGKPLHVGGRVRSVSTGDYGTVVLIHDVGITHVIHVVYDGDPREHSARGRALRAMPTGDDAVQELREALAPSTPGFGPYETEQAAGEDAPVPGTAQQRRRWNAENLHAACRSAGVELGGYDEEAIRWLSRWDPQIVQSIVGMISRAGAR